jgi:hypothetical protein
MNPDDKLVYCLVLFSVATAFAMLIVSGAWIDNKRIDPVPFESVEQIKITNVDFNSNNTAIVTTKNSAPAAATIESARINGTVATLKPIEGSTATIPKGTSASFMVILQDECQFSLGERYLFRLETSKGTICSYTATYNATT